MLTSTLEAVSRPSWKRLPLCTGQGQCWSNSLARLRVSRAAHELPCLPNEFAEHSLVRAARVNKWTVARDFADPGAKQTTRRPPQWNIDSAHTVISLRRACG